jgi:hypothetical protein
MSTVIVVLGNHRSGTSCVAGVLHHLGVPMGAVLPAGVNNPVGQFEDSEFLELHRAILGERVQGRIVNEAWHWPKPEPTESQRAAYASLVAGRCKARSVWGVKDPRLCFFAPMLLFGALPSDTDLRCVHVHRAPKAAAASLAARDHLHSDYATRVIERYAAQLHTNALRKARRLGPVLTLDYDWVTVDPECAVDALRHFVSKSDFYPHAGAAASALAFIDPSLNHHGAAA